MSNRFVKIIIQDDFQILLKDPWLISQICLNILLLLSNEHFNLKKQIKTPHIKYCIYFINCFFHWIRTNPVTTSLCNLSMYGPAVWNACDNKTYFNLFLMLILTLVSIT